MRLMSVVVIACLLVGCGEEVEQGITGPGQSGVEAVKAMPANAETLQVTIAGMNCNGCANRIEHHMGQVAGIAACDVTFVEGTPGPAAIAYDPAVIKPAAIVSALEGIKNYKIALVDDAASAAP